MKLQEGKRYVRRDGQISGVIEHNPFNYEYPFVDADNRNTYSKDGLRFIKGLEHASDLVGLHYDSEPVNPAVSDPSMVVISAKEYNRLKDIEAHLKELQELWNEIQAEKA